jgi:hypothetical protein
MIYKKTKMIAASLLIVSAVGHVLNSFVPNETAISCAAHRWAQIA